jgi:Fe-S-cluster containining protein
VQRDDQACERFEPRFDATACGECGACCRQGFHLVSVRPKDRVATKHPQLVRRDQHGPHLPRPDGRCVALDAPSEGASTYRCRIYVDRPKACAEFEVASDACLIARRRVGLSR